MTNSAITTELQHLDDVEPFAICSRRDPLAVTEINIMPARLNQTCPFTLSSAHGACGLGEALSGKRAGT